LDTKRIVNLIQVATFQSFTAESQSTRRKPLENSANSASLRFKSLVCSLFMMRWQLGLLNMTAFFRKHSTPILFFLLVTLLILSWMFPSSGLLLGILFLLLSFFIASSAVLQKHREAYLQGRITRRVFLRNVLLECTGIVLAMLLAGVLGRYMAGIATRQIRDDLIRVSAGIMVGLLVGMGVGTCARKTWGQLAKV
jgi:hypothetical protein